MEHQDDIHERLAEDLRAGSVRRDRELAKFFWRGSHDASLVHRIGAGILGSWLFIMGLVVGRMAFTKTNEDTAPLAIAALLLLYLGTRLIRNAVLRRPT